MALKTVDIVIRCGKEIIGGAQDAHVLVPVSASGECKHCCVSTKGFFHFDAGELCYLPFSHTRRGFFPFWRFLVNVVRLTFDGDHIYVPFAHRDVRMLSILHSSAMLLHNAESKCQSMFIFTLSSATVIKFVNSIHTVNGLSQFRRSAPTRQHNQ